VGEGSFQPANFISATGDIEMKTWTRPDFKEVNLACEINCYAPAEF
jgi:coenzyme PQQ precursor peptide PqqA